MSGSASRIWRAGAAILGMASSRSEAARATSKTAVFLVSIVVIVFGDWILEESLMSSATAWKRL